MKGKKIFITVIIINILSIGVIYNFIKKDYINNEKIIVKAMTETEYEDNISSLNTSHEEYANYIEESKKKIASAITEKGVPTSDEETLETMANNIKNIAGDVSELVTESELTRATSIVKSCDINDTFIVYAYYDYLSNIDGGTILDTKKLPSVMDSTLYLVKATSTTINITWTQINQAMFIQLI